MARKDGQPELSLICSQLQTGRDTYDRPGGVPFSAPRSSRFVAKLGRILAANRAAQEYQGVVPFQSPQTSGTAEDLTRNFVADQAVLTTGIISEFLISGGEGKHSELSPWKKPKGFKIIGLIFFESQRIVEILSWFLERRLPRRSALGCKY